MWTNIKQKIFLLLGRIFFRYERTYERILYEKKILSKVVNKGVGCYLNGKIKITNIRGVVFGNNVHFGENTYINSVGGVYIGDNVHVSRNVTIYSTNHNYEGNAIPYDHTLVTKSVVIENNAWIGMNVSILPGVTIGEGAIIGMGSIVSKDIPSLAIAVGNPCSVIKLRDKERYWRNIDDQKIAGKSGELLSPSQLSKFLVPANYRDGENLVFVVGTGRSGSHAVSQMFERSKKINAFHEPHLSLRTLATKYANGIVNKNDVKRELNAIYNCGKIDENKYYLESEQKLSHFIPLLNELFPRCKFIWLIRNPYHFIKSSVARNWYKDTEISNGNVYFDQMLSNKTLRINAYEVKDMSKHEWIDLNIFERNAWYWGYLNTVIQEELSRIDSTRWIKIKTEELSTQVGRIASFLKVPQSEITPKRTNIVKKRDILKYQGIAKQEIDKKCGKVLHKYVNLY